MPYHRSKKVLFWPYLSYDTKKSFLVGGGGGWVSIFLNFWTHRHTETEMDTELDNISHFVDYLNFDQINLTNRRNLHQTVSYWKRM